MSKKNTRHLPKSATQKPWARTLPYVPTPAPTWTPSATGVHFEEPVPVRHQWHVGRIGVWMGMIVRVIAWDDHGAVCVAHRTDLHWLPYTALTETCDRRLLALVRARRRWRRQ